MDMKRKYRNALFTLSKWILWGGIIGAAAGSTTAILIKVNDFLGDDIREHHFSLIYFLPLAGVLIGYLYMKYGKESSEGNNLIIDAVHDKAKVLRRMGPIVYIGTFLTVLFGGSTGREGAAIQMGGSIAEVVNRTGVHIRDRNILLMSGISAGFGAAFGTPVTGAVFGMEMTAAGKMKYEAFVPCLTASLIGHYMTEAVWNVKHEMFRIEAVPKLSPATFAIVIAVSVICSLISVLYCQLRHGIQSASETYFKSNHMVRAFAGGLVIVILTLIIGSQDYNGRGIQMLEQSFHEHVPPFAFLAKLIFTAVTLGSGFVGGEAIPLFFIGAALGNTLSSFIDVPISFLAALGLIATFCGGANTPVAAFLLSIEMFDGKGIEYFFVACVTSYICSGHHGLWPSQTMYDPKSRLYNVMEGETIGNIEKSKFPRGFRGE